jgi:hypothetical protein
VTIEDIELKPGSKQGDGFSSDIAAVHFLASFNGEKLRKNYIAKYAPEGKRGDWLKKVNIFI